MRILLLILLNIMFISCNNESKTNATKKTPIKAESSSSVPAESKGTTNALTIIEPVKWTTETRKISETDYELIFVANIEEDYHLYSQKVPENGPLPTVFIFEDSDAYDLIEPTSEEKGETAYDTTFEMDIKSFKNKAIFKQRIKTKTKNPKILAEIEFMTCNDSKCLNGYSDVEFQI